jgi:hypothetical protein
METSLAQQSKAWLLRCSTVANLWQQTSTIGYSTAGTLMDSQPPLEPINTKQQDKKDKNPDCFLGTIRLLLQRM